MQDKDIIEDDELHEHYAFVASEKQSPLRLDKFLMNFIENATRSKIQKAAKNGHIFVNGNVEKQSYKVKPHDSVRILFEHPLPDEFILKPESIDINIIYEDESLLVVDKPPGMVVHPGHGNYTGTLINGILYHLKDQNTIPMNRDRRPGLVHRIDKDTSGLLVIAKTEQAMYHLTRQFFHKTSDREYIALVWGHMEKNEGKIIGHIGRHPKNRLQMTVFEDGSHGKEAVTHYNVLERFRYVSLVSCKLETGRTHQIRAHMKYLGHTLFNDERYGGNAVLKGTLFNKYRQFVDNCFKILPRQALHAHTLGFIHPKTEEKMNFKSPLPKDISECVDRWRNYSNFN